MRINRKDDFHDVEYAINRETLVIRRLQIFKLRRMMWRNKGRTSSMLEAT
jgi:hypothetical protein